MAITSVASSTIFPSSAAASQPVASSATPKSAVAGATSPSVISSISNGAGPGTTSGDVQSRINGINALIQNAENFNWSAGDPSITPEEIAQAQSTEAQHLLDGEGATIVNADEQGLQGISFNFLPIDFPASTSASQSSSIDAASQAVAGTSNPVQAVARAAVTLSGSPPSSTALQAGSSQIQVSSQAQSLILSGETLSPSTSTANIALSVLTAASQQSSSQTATIPTTRQVYDFYA